MKKSHGSYFTSIFHIFQNHANLGPGQYEIKSCIDDWKSEHKMRHGRFGKVQQYPDQPTDRIYAFSLSQNPRKPVHKTNTVFIPKEAPGARTKI